jgi:hypothetical protein
LLRKLEFKNFSKYAKAGKSSCEFFFLRRCRQFMYAVHCPKSSLENILAPKFPSQHGDIASSLLENFFSAISKEEVPLAYEKISLP